MCVGDGECCSGQMEDVSELTMKALWWRPGYYLQCLQWAGKYSCEVVLVRLHQKPVIKFNWGSTDTKLPWQVRCHWLPQIWENAEQEGKKCDPMAYTEVHL